MSEERVKLLDEHKEYLKREYPDFSNQFCMFPPNFDYNRSKIKTIEGFHKEFKPGDSKLEKEWKEATNALDAEEQAKNATWKVFSQRPGTMVWDGFETKNFFKSAAHALHEKYAERMKDQPALDIDLNEEEKDFYEIRMKIDIDKFNNKVEKLVENICNGKTRVSKIQVEESDIDNPFPQQLNESQIRTVKNQIKK